jgi:hypothetical protein
MNKVNMAVIRKAMIRFAEDCRDECGEINHTKLAENVCQALNGYDGDDIPEEYFEAAINFNETFSI